MESSVIPRVAEASPPLSLSLSLSLRDPSSLSASVSPVRYRCFKKPHVSPRRVGFVPWKIESPPKIIWNLSNGVKGLKIHRRVIYYITRNVCRNSIKVGEIRLSRLDSSTRATISSSGYFEKPSENRFGRIGKHSTRKLSRRGLYFRASK